MRRKDREMDESFGLSVIDDAAHGILAAVDSQNLPYCLPLSIVRDGDILYFHSAKEGDKVEIFKNKPRVCVSFVGHVQVPNNYTEEELDETIKDETKTVLLISKVFTTEFESAIVKGRVEPVDEGEEQVHAMRLICQKYTPGKMKYFVQAVKAGLDRAQVYKIQIEEITAKRKKYDEHGEEMKWGRKV